MKRNRNRRRPRATRSFHNIDRIYEGQAYVFEGQGDSLSRRTLYCAYRERWRCPGRGVVYNDHFRLTQKHNHPAHGNLEPTDRFLHELCQCCTRQLRDLNDVYDSLEATHSEAALRLDYDVVRERMRQWRCEMDFPQIKNSYITLFEKLTGDYSSLLQCSNGPLEVDLFAAGGPFETITLTDVDLIRSLAIPSITSLVVTSVKGLHCSQLQVEEIVLVSAICGDHAYPCIWGLLKSPIECSYNAVSTKMLEMFRNEDLPVYTSYEHAMYNALRRVFQNVKGTFYEFIMILSSMVHRCDLDEPEVLDIVILKKVFALALIPPGKVIDTYKQLCCLLPAAQKERMSKFLQYFESTWLLRVGPEEMSVWNDYLRTSDVQKCFRQEMEKLQNSSIFDSLQLIIQVQEKSQKDASRQVKYWVPRVKNLVQPIKSLKLTWQRYQNHDIDEMEVLEYSSFFLTKCINDVIYYPDLSSNFEVFSGIGRQMRVLREYEFLQVQAAPNQRRIMQQINPSSRRSRSRTKSRQGSENVFNSTNSLGPVDEHIVDVSLFDMPGDDCNTNEEEKTKTLKEMRNHSEDNVGGV